MGATSSIPVIVTKEAALEVVRKELKEMAKYKIPPPTESEEQITLFNWASLAREAFPELLLLYHIPNGGKRHKTTAIRLKKEGVKAGVPDIHLPVARAGYHGLFIELKAGKGKTTKNQDTWIAELTKQGYFVEVCHGWEVASKVIINYLKNNIECRR